MILHVLQRHPSLRIQHKKFTDEILRFFTHMRREFQIQSANAFIRLFLRLCFEGRITTQKLVSQYTDTPIVNSRIVGLVIHHLWSQVIQRAAQVCGSGIIECSPAKARYFRLILYNHCVIIGKYVGSEENVLWLDVAMNHMHLVTVVNRGCNLTDIGRRSSLTESLALQQAAVHISTWTVIHNEVYTLLILKATIQVKDVLVLKEIVEADSQFNVLLDSTLLQLILANDFDGHNEFGLKLTSEIHTTY